MRSDGKITQQRKSTLRQKLSSQNTRNGVPDWSRAWTLPGWAYHQKPLALAHSALPWFVDHYKNYPDFTYLHTYTVGQSLVYPQYKRGLSNAKIIALSRVCHNCISAENRTSCKEINSMHLFLRQKARSAIYMLSLKVPYNSRMLRVMFIDNFHKTLNIIAPQKRRCLPLISVVQYCHCRCASQGVWEYPEVPEKEPVPAMLW